MDTIELSTRRIELDGCHNLRDTGGYLTSDGRRTKWGTLFRADGLHQLGTDSQKKLLDYSIRTIIDLRRSDELVEQPNVFAQSLLLVYLNISLVEDRNEARTLPGLFELNQRMLDNSQSQIKMLVQSLAEASRFPALVHCTAGKDRTGLVIALLLSLVNVPDATIAEDYALSAEYLTPLFEQLRQKIALAGEDLSQFEKLLAAHPQTMLDTLAYLKSKYGGAREYLLGLGLSHSELNLIQESLTEALD